MGVRVDAAGDDAGVGGVEGLVAGKVLVGGGDGSALDQQVGLPRASAVTRVPFRMTLDMGGVFGWGGESVS